MIDHRPTNAAEMRTFLNKRADARPANSAPIVQVDGSTATIRLFDPIDAYGEWWGLSAKEFAAALDSIPSNVSTIELLVNSPGGDVFDGVAIVNTMRAHPARTRAVVQGLAASAASFIACAADETVMMPNSTLMVHNAWGVCIGNADDMVEFASLLEKISDNIADIYARKSGRPVDEMRELMNAESWLSDVESVAAGLADSIGEAAPAPSNRTDPTPVAAAGACASLDYMIARNAQARRTNPNPTTNSTGGNPQ